MIIEIPMKLPSLNEYINKCRYNKYVANNYKQKLEQEIGWYLVKLPKFKKPIKIDFVWVEENKRRDLDNVCFAKKFILDSLVKCGKLKDDNRRYVTAFTDNFKYGKTAKVILNVQEIESEE